MQVSPAG